MTNFKGTKGKWVYDKIKNAIIRENVNGLLATAWGTYNSDIYEKRLENESWLSMRERTQSIRDNCELEQKANALLISKAPEMLEMLMMIAKGFDDSKKHLIIKKCNQLIKEATEL